MQYRFYLDGNLLQDEPKGWKELVTSITEYDEIRAILLTQDVTLTFIGDGYTYLRNIFESDQVCALTELRIEYRCSSDYEEIFKGNVFLTSVSFLNNECKTKVEDDSFFAKINNNKSIKAYLNVARSKNNVTITAASSSTMNFFNPCDCTYAEVRTGYKIFEAFKYIIAFMSDGEVGFVSDEFDIGGDWEGHRVTTGWALRDPNETDVRVTPYLSFKDLFQEVNKKYNIGMSVEIVAGIPSIRIEPFPYFRTDVPSVTFGSPSNVEISTEVSQLYAKVIIGSDKLQDTDSCSVGGHANFPENVNYVGFKEEEFPLLTECNLDTELNLVSSYIISHNVIEKLVFVGNDQYDEDIVFVDAAPGGLVTQTDVFNDGNCYYNAFYSNQNTLNRWNSALPNIVQVIIGNANNTSIAYLTNTRTFNLNQSVTSYATGTTDGFGNPIEKFDDDWNLGNDVSNNYGTTVNPVVQVPQGTPVGVTESIFRVPLNGNYRFVHHAKIFGMYTTALTGCTLNMTITITQYDSTGAVLDVFSQFDAFGLVYATPVNNASIQCDTGVIGCSSGDYISVKYAFSNTSSDLIWTTNWKFNGTNDTPVPLGPTSFACTFTQSYGGTLTRTLNTDFANILFKFEYPITYEQFKTIRNDTKKPIEFDLCNKTYKAWIRDIKYNHHKNSKLTLIISKNGYRGN